MCTSWQGVKDKVMQQMSSATTCLVCVHCKHLSGTVLFFNSLLFFAYNTHTHTHTHTYTHMQCTYAHTTHTHNVHTCICNTHTHTTHTPHKDATMGAEPFYDLEQHALLGVANVFLECLHHSVPHDYPAPIIAPTGMVRESITMCHRSGW